MGWRNIMIYEWGLYSFILLDQHIVIISIELFQKYLQVHPALELGSYYYICECRIAVTCHAC